MRERVRGSAACVRGCEIGAAEGDREGEGEGDGCVRGGVGCRSRSGDAWVRVRWVDSARVGAEYRNDEWSTVRARIGAPCVSVISIGIFIT